MSPRLIADKSARKPSGACMSAGLVAHSPIASKKWRDGRRRSSGAVGRFSPSADERLHTTTFEDFVRRHGHTVAPTTNLVERHAVRRGRTGHELRVAPWRDSLGPNHRDNVAGWFSLPDSACHREELIQHAVNLGEFVTDALGFLVLSVQLPL